MVSFIHEYNMGKARANLLFKNTFASNDVKYKKRNKMFTVLFLTIKITIEVF